MSLITLLLLLAFTVAIIVQTRRHATAASHQNFLHLSARHGNSSADLFGCSILCCEPTEVEHIQRLLDCEHCRFEVIVAINPALQGDVFRQIIRHYKMVRVNNSHPQETPAPDVNALYRSRQRGYRHLLVIDSAVKSPCEALNVALNASSYNHIIPLGGTTHLRRSALATLALTLTDESNRDAELILCDGSAPCYILQRDPLVERGGFSPSLVEQYPAESKRLLYLALADRCDEGNTLTLCILITSALSLLTITALLMGALVAACVAATIVLSTAAARYAIACREDEKCSLRALLYQKGKIAKFFRSENSIFHNFFVSLRKKQKKHNINDRANSFR